LVYRLATGWTVRGSNPRAGKILLTRQDRPWSAPDLLYSRYRLSLARVYRQELDFDHPPSSVEVKKRVELYSSSGPSWPVIGPYLPFTLYGLYLVVDDFVLSSCLS